jgi:uncharacterized protein (DUF1810 family)
MWYIFPQLRGLGRSEMACAYGISGEQEARDYLEEPTLRARLEEICEALLLHEGKSAVSIFGQIDAAKLRSSMTLFAYISPEGSVFHKVLDAFFEGETDKTTTDSLKFA